MLEEAIAAYNAGRSVVVVQLNLACVKYTEGLLKHLDAPPGIPVIEATNTRWFRGRRVDAAYIDHAVGEVLPWSNRQELWKALDAAVGEEK